MGAPWEADSQKTSLEFPITFEGGHNAGVPAIMAGANQSTHEFGWGTNKFPALASRPIHVNVGTQEIGLFCGLGLYNATTFIRQLGNTVYSSPDAITWTTIGTMPSGTIEFNSTMFEVGGKPAIIITNGTDPVKYWDGTAFADLSASAPIGKYITTDTVRLWIAKGKELHFCAFLAPTDWTSARNSGSLEYYTPDGGDITALYRYEGRIMVFKEQSLAEIHGTNYFEFRLIDVPGKVGCNNQKTIAQVGTSLFWRDRNDVWMYEGYPTPIGAQIRKHLDASPPGPLDMAFTDGLRYYLCLGVTGTTLCYDPRYKLWRVDNVVSNILIPNGAVFKSNQLYLHTRTSNQMVTKTFTESHTETARYDTASYSMGAPQAEKELYEIHVQVYLAAGAKLEVRVSTQERGEVWTLIDTINGSGGPALATDHIIPLDTVPLCKWVRFRFDLTGYGEIYSAVVYYNLIPVQH